MNVLKMSILILIMALTGCRKDKVLPIEKISNTLKSSYDASNRKQWLNIPNGFASFVQLDYNLDGNDDIIQFEGYDLSLKYNWPSPQFYSGTPLTQANVSVSDKRIFASKMITGDLDQNGFPDVFLISGMDPDNNCPTCEAPLLPNHIMFNIDGKSFIVKSLEVTATWSTASAGDIDGDGDLDIVAFNTSHGKGRLNQLLINDGKGKFIVRKSGIDLLEWVDRAELIDINKDGKLDLVMNDVINTPNYTNRFRILWGNGSDFTENNSIRIEIPNDMRLLDIDAYDFDKDGYSELVLPMNYLYGNWKLFVYKTINNTTYVNSNMIESNTILSSRLIPYNELISINDVDGNNKMDVFVNDKKVNLRWEFDTDKLKLK
jgi:hypothetical protein